MEKIFFTIIVCMFIPSTFGYSQLTSPDQLSIDAGISIPTAPEQFSDYWNNGVHAGISILYTTRYPYVGILSLDYNYFSFDEAQLNKKLNMQQGAATVSGAITSNYRLSSGMNYYFQADPLFVPFVSAGVSLSYLQVSEATVTYPVSVKRQNSSYKIYLSFYFGGGITFPVYNGMDFILSLERGISFKKDQTVNTDFYTIKIGALWNID